MNKETITDNLEKLLMAIHRQVVVIRDADEQIPKIEMDKTLSNIRALYEQFTVLNYLNSYPPEKQSAETVTEFKPIETKKEIEPPFIPIDEKKEETIISPIEQTPVQPKIEKPEEAGFEKYMPQQPIEKKVEPEKIEPKPELIKPIQQAPPKEDKQTAGDSQRLADKLRSQKLDDLHKAVTLSDKFLYMNELFEAENSSYKEAIDMLNRLTVWSEAEHYMDSLAARYKWNEHEKVEKKFRELVSRKFV